MSLFASAFGLLGKDVAVSLVDDAFLFTTQDRPQPLVLPAYVALQAGTRLVLACGEEAKAMRGREPANITVAGVLTEGVVTDTEVAQALFRFGIRTLFGRKWIIRPRVIIACRTGETGRAAVKHMAVAGGAREVYLIEPAMATAIGMDLDVQKPEIRAVLSLSNDWFEFSVISLAGILAKTDGAIGVQAFVEDIRNHLTLSRQFRPDAAALEAQLFAGGIEPGVASETAGWEVWAGRSERGRVAAQSLSPADLAVGMMPSLTRLAERIKGVFHSLPGDQRFQLNTATIHAAGSSMAIPGLAQALANQLGHPVVPFSADAHPSIEGTRRILQELRFLRKVQPKGHP